MISFNYMIIEIKLIKEKIKELIDKLLKDKQNKICNKKLLYVVLINPKI